MFPLTGTNALILAPIFGFAFGWLLNRRRVTSYNVIINQFRMRDFTVLKIMLTAIIVGGVGVFFLADAGLARWAIRDANMGGVILGGLMFGVGMVLYGYCPGTGFAAIGSGCLHALVGAGGMLAGAIAYAYAFDWVRANILAWWNLGRVSLADVTGVPMLGLYAGLAVFALGFFLRLERRERAAR